MKFADRRSSSSRHRLPVAVAERERRQKLARRKLLLESLENRSLLATLALQVNLYADNGGVPGALIANDTVTAGQDFWVEIKAQDTSAVPSGLIDLSLDIGFSAANFEEIDNPFDPVNSPTIITADFPIFRDGTLDNTAGTIDELSGAALPNNGNGKEIGVAGFERFALLKFNAESAVVNSPLNITIGTGSAAFADGSSLDSATIEQQTITVTDGIQASITEDVTQAEGNAGTTNYSFTVTLDAAAATDVVIPWTFAHGETTDADFDAGLTKAGKVTIPAGQLSAVIPAFAVLGDLTVERDETFTVTLGTPETAGVGLSVENVGTGTITNDDSAIIVITGPASTAEGNAGNTPVEFTVTLSAPVDVPVSVNYQTKDDTATVAGNDYTPTSGTITFNAGSTSAIKIPVNILGDTNIEGDESFVVQIDGLVAGAPARNVTIETNSALATIDDDDTSAITITSVSIEEGNAGTKNLKFSIGLTNPVPGEVSLQVDTQDGTATAGSDYTATSKTITFTANSVGPIDFEVPINGDNTVELDEVFNVLLSNLNSGPFTVTLPAGPITGTITNDDSATITLAPVSQNEGDAGTSNMVFTATLSNPVDVNVTVVFDTADGTATVANNDYTATNNQIITFTAGGPLTQTISVPIVGDTTVEPDESFTAALSNVQAAGRNVTAGNPVVGTILDDDNDLPAASIGDVAILEGNAGETLLVFTITLDKSNPLADVVLEVSTQDVTALAGVDYTAFTNQVVTIAKDTTSQTVTVKLNGDTLVEKDETFKLSITKIDGNAIIRDGEAIGTITNDDTALASIDSVTQVEGNAGTTNFDFTVTIDHPAAFDVVIPWSFSHIDTNDADFGAALTKTGKVTIPAGSTSAKITPSFPVNGDTTLEKNETFSVTLGTPEQTEVTLAQSKVGTGTITNDDQVTVSINNVTDTEPANGNTKNFDFTVTLSAAAEVDVVVPWTFTNVTTVDADFGAGLTKSGKVTIPAGATSAQITGVFPVAGDLLTETNETFSVTLGTPETTGAVLNDASKVGTGTVLDASTAVVASIANKTLAEGNSGNTAFDFTVTLDKASPVDVVIPWTFANGTTANTDFSGLATTGKVTIAAGATTGKISFNVIGDTVLEGDETFTVTLGTPETPNASVNGNAKTATGTISNDDSVIVSINNVTDTEPTNGNTKNFDFTVTLSAAADIDVVVPWTFTNITTVDADFGAGLTKSGKVTIPAGSTSAKIAGAFPVAGDLLAENNETFTVTLGTPETSGAVLANAEKIGTGTIIDQAAAVVASITDKAQAEGNSGTTAFDFTVTLDKASPVDVVIPWTFANGTTANTDFSGLATTGKVTILAGATTGKISFNVVGDTVLEANENFTVTLGTPETANASVNANAKTGTGTINNDDQVTVTINSVNDVEPANGNTKNFDFTVTLSAAADIDVVVPWTFTNVTSSDADFGAGLTKSGKVTIPAGATSAKITGAFPVAGDLISETPETFTVTLAAPETTGAVLAAANTVGTGTINDVTTVVASIDSKTLNEGNSGTTNFDFTVTLDKVSSVDVVIPWTFTNVTTNDADFGAGLTKSGKVTIPAGQLSAKITPSFPVNGDTTLEANETFTVTLGTPETATAIVNDNAKVGTGTITNDDAVVVSITDKVQQTEGNSGTKNFDFTVSIDKAAGVDVVVPYTFANVTTSDADFSNLTKTGKVTIPAGQTSVKISPTFAVVGDTAFEADETFTVTLSTPETAGATLSATAKVGTGTIQNDDTITASINAVTKAEGNSGTTNFDFEVSIDQVSSVDVVIPWTFTNVTTADSDFAASLTKSGKVTIPAGQTKATIPSFLVNGDTLVELDETFTVTLGTPETAGVVLSSTAKIGTGTVQNDDTATASIKAVTQAEGNSGNTNFEFTVTIDKAAAVDVTIPWTFANVTTKDNDFSGTLTKSGNVTIPAGSTSVKIPAFLVLGDTTVEADETFTVTLGTPDRSSVVLSATEKIATGTVTNDDSATISIGNATVIEPSSGTKTITLPITMTQPADVDVTVTYTFTNGSTTDPDFGTLTKTGTVVIPAGKTSPDTPLSFNVASDAIDEPNETFTVTLSNPTFTGGGARNVTIPAASSVGTGTITEDPGTATLSGFAYVDGNNNGVKDAGEVGIPGVTITLTGTPTGGSAITLTAMSADDGSYSFTNLLSGTYAITETQPTTMFDGTDVVGTQGGTLANDKISAITLDAAEAGTGNNFGELGLLPQFVTKRLFLASTPAFAQTLRVINGRAAELAGNQTLADSIFNATVPSVVSAGNNANAAAAAANNNAAAAEFVADDSSSAGEDVAPLAATNTSAAGEAIEDDSPVVATQQQAAAANTSTSTAKTSTSKTSAAKSTTTKSTTSTSSAVKSTIASTLSKRTSTLQSLRSSSATPSTGATADAMQLAALDEVLSREKKWR
ncbi:Calx-beta domain-containing protein [Anatilimnocola floriformis]|uniref:Calx-beta domain-containing protein n=1 Tax=Anatilimnocola floriformis TaxID=2948575 RepID=UPI0020C53914|nr:Calx-beta domain-containing protein [Anatilimnocola floriformis]